MKFWLVRFAVICLFLPIGTAFAQGGLVTQLEKDSVDITTHFTGEQLLFFGSLSSPGDVIVKVVSPLQTVAVSRKKQVGVMWLDGGRLVVRDTPGLYYLASTRPIAELLCADERARFGLSLEHPLKLARTEGGKVPGWEEAFLRLKKAKQYYRELEHGVTLVKDTLFFTRLDLPAKLPEGKYELNAYLVKNGKVVATQTAMLNVQEVSMERWVSSAAHDNPWLYGLSFTLLCMAIGLTLGIILRGNKDD